MYGSQLQFFIFYYKLLHTYYYIYALIIGATQHLINCITMIYLDNNATTIVPPEVIKQTVLWINRGNPSASYKSAVECRELMKEFRNFIATSCNFISYECDTKYTTEELKRCYHIIFNSGASESNNAIVRQVTTAYKFHTKKTPHVIVSSIEHKSLIECVNQLVGLGLIEATFVKPNALGFIEPERVQEAIKSNTALISIMSANNETGAIMNIKAIGKIAHDARIPFHTDAVQTFGKYLIDPLASNVDAFSVSFHKLHGCKGTGLLVIKKQFIDGYHLLPEICGTQNSGFRGGTENISGIAGSYTATKLTWTDRTAKNKRLAEIKKRMITLLSEAMHCQTYREYLEKPLNVPMQIVFISTSEKVYLPNTLMLSVVKRTAPDMCNVELKKKLEAAGIIISIGSACNTSSSKASHVLTEMNVDTLIRKGAVRITIGDENPIDDADKFVGKFLEVLKTF